MRHSGIQGMGDSYELEKGRPRFDAGGMHFPSGATVPYYGGEFHYWRHEPRDWRAIFARLREAGLTVAGTFVLFNVHETRPGEFDYAGRSSPRRDLLAWLRLAREQGLYTHLRVGPACCEWRESGASSFGTPWAQCLDSLIEAVQGETASNGGSLIALQVDNEWVDPLGMFEMACSAYGGFDGFHRPPPVPLVELIEPNFHFVAAGERWSLDPLADDLRARYGDIGALNRAWSSNYADFADVPAALRRQAGDTFRGLIEHLDHAWRGLRPASNLRPFHDLARWLKRYMAVPLRRHVELARRLDAALTHNWPMGVEADFNTLAGLELSGYDLYQRTDADIWDWTLMAKDMQENVLPYSAEFMCGAIAPYLWGAQGRYDEGFARLSLLSYLAQGLRAVNLYMFAERDNWSQSPLDARGAPRPAYRALASVFHALRETDWHRRPRRADVAVVRQTATLHQRTRETFADRGLPFAWLRDALYGGLDIKQALYDLYLALHEAHIDFAAHRADDTLTLPPGYRVVLTPCAPFMERAIADALVALAQGGATVILFPSLPGVDLDGQPLAWPLAGGATQCRVGAGRLVVLDHAPRQGDAELLALLAAAGARSFAATDAARSDAHVFGGDNEAIVIAYNGNHRQAVQTLTLHPDLLPAAAYEVVDLLQRRVLERGWGNGKPCAVACAIPPRDATVLAVVPAGRVALPARRRTPPASFPLRDGRMRVTALADQLEVYASPREESEWMAVGLGDWTLTALASGACAGVQGWFWLNTTARAPQTWEGEARLELELLGWHHLAQVFAQGAEIGRIYQERPAARAEFDLRSHAVPGEPLTVALRVLRQTLDCHDKGAAGIRHAVLRFGAQRVPLEHWRLQQENEPADAPPLGPEQPATLPLALEMARNQETLWLQGTLETDAGAAADDAWTLRIAGAGFRAWAWLDGVYIGSTPYLPAALPLDGAPAPGPHTLTLRLQAEPCAAATCAQADRYELFVASALERAPLLLDTVALERNAGVDRGIAAG